jgi:hypothetical protein
MNHALSMSKTLTAATCYISLTINSPNTSNCSRNSKGWRDLRVESQPIDTPRPPVVQSILDRLEYTHRHSVPTDAIPSKGGRGGPLVLGMKQHAAQTRIEARPLESATASIAAV